MRGVVLITVLSVLGFISNCTNADQNQLAQSGAKFLGTDGKCHWKVSGSNCPAAQKSFRALEDARGTDVVIGQYRISWQSAASEGLQILDKASSKVIWRTPPGKSFISYHRGPWKTKEVKGFIDMQLLAEKTCHINVFSRVSAEDGQLKLEGGFADKDCPERYELTWTLNKQNDLQYELKLLSPSLPKGQRQGLTLVMERDDKTQFYGFGEQFSHIGLRGYRLPMWVQEQGLGRGDFPVSPLVAFFSSSEVPGYAFSTYYVNPVWMDTTGFTHVGANAEPGFIDLSKRDRIEISYVTDTLKGTIGYRQSPLDQVSWITKYTGRMQALPDWVHDGLILGVQGGSDVVEEVVSKLQAYDTPLSAVWLQDWVGARKTSFGSQLWWNWILDEERYPRWEQTRDRLRSQGIRILSYVNPHLVKLEGRQSRRRLFDEAESLGYLVRRPDGEPYLIENTDFKYGLVDIFNPKASAWFKSVLRNEVWNQGISGYMSDFGESLPLDAVLSTPGRELTAHNTYPERWAQLHREFIEEEGLEDEAFIINRSGFTQSPKYAVAFWLGDQNVAWSRHDGLPSAIRGLISGGFTGLALNHSDIGGYTTLKSPIPFTSVVRSQELLLRWAEVNAFTPIFRSHEGNRPEDNHQIWSSSASLKGVAAMARVYRSLKPYRQELENEMEEKGWPLIRHMYLHYPEDPESPALDLQFMLGADLLVAPVVEKGEESVDLYVPTR